MYEEQLVTLKNHITKLKEHFGEFENISDLHKMVTKENRKCYDWVQTGVVIRNITFTVHIFSNILAIPCI